MITPWYKEPWAWLVFFLPFTAVVAGIATYIIANHEPDSLVVGEYYKEGKAINMKLAKVKLAQKLGMRFQLKYQDQILTIVPTGIEKIFPVLNIRFFHPTLQANDFKLSMTPDGNGHFRKHIEHDIAGKWQITLSSFDERWQIQNKITLPQSDYIDIIPDPIEAN